MASTPDAGSDHVLSGPVTPATARTALTRSKGCPDERPERAGGAGAQG